MSVFLYTKNDFLCFHDTIVPHEVVYHIFSKLDVRSLLNVDAVSTQFHSLTARTWEYHREQEKMDFGWHFLKNHPQKWSYFCNLRAKQHFLQNTISIVFTTAVSEDLHKKNYNYYRQQTDSLLMQLALYRRALKGEFHPHHYSNMSFSNIEQKELSLLPSKDAEGGDLLLKWSLYGETSASGHLKAAIQKGMTWASFLQLAHRGFESCSIELALAAASKGDYSGIQLLLHMQPQQFSCFDTLKDTTPVLAALISIAKADLLSNENNLPSNEDLLTASALYQDAINTLKCQSLPIPNYILIKAAKIEGQLGNLDEAILLYKDCREMKKDETSSALFLNAHIPIEDIKTIAEFAYQQQDWNLANKLFTQVIKSYDPGKLNREARAELCRIMPQLAAAKEHQQDYEGACETYNQIITYYRQTPNKISPLHIIVQAIAVMEQLQNWQEAFQLCETEINCYTGYTRLHPPHQLETKSLLLKNQLKVAKLFPSCPPELAFFVQDPSIFTLYQQSLENIELSISYDLLPDADALYTYLGDWNKVDLVYLHLFQVCREHAPNTKISTKIFVQAAYVKEQLGNLVEAKNVYDDILAQDKEVTPDIIYRAGCIEKELDNLPDADKRFSRALELYGLNKAPLQVLIDAAFVKEQLQEWSGADCIYTEIIDVRRDNTDPELLDKAAFVKVKLGFLEQADSLYTKAIKAYENVMFLPSLFEDAAGVKEKLGKWEEADALYTRIIAECEDDTPIGVLVKARHVKAQLQQKDTLLSQAVNKLKIKD
jgi:tetratricopeptide (TPR) repeat protein